MRVWVVDDQKADSPESLEGTLRAVAVWEGGRLTVVGAGPFRPGLVAELRGGRPDLLVVRGAAWPDGAALREALEAGPALVVATTPEGCRPFLALAEAYPVTVVPAAPAADGLHLALLGALAARKRYAEGKAAVAQLQQRLADRIVIEKAKGVLVRRLGIGEDEAYKRLRVLSRRQRRPVRDVAQSFLDTETLLLPEVNGASEGHEARCEPTAVAPPKDTGKAAAEGLSGRVCG